MVSLELKFDFLLLLMFSTGHALRNIVTRGIGRVRRAQGQLRAFHAHIYIVGKKTAENLGLLMELINLLCVCAQL